MRRTRGTSLRIGKKSYSKMTSAKRAALKKAQRAAAIARRNNSRIKRR